MPTRPLIAAGPFGSELSASQVAAAIARGLHAGGVPDAEVCVLLAAGAPRAGGGGGRRRRSAEGELQELLAGHDFDARMRRARAVVLAQRCLQERTLAGSAAFEIATRARQAGVPSYAVTAENRLHPFDARILDLQVVLEAGNARALAAAGRRLARLL